MSELSIPNLTLFLYYHYANIPNYFLKGLQYGIEYTKAKIAELEYKEKKAAAEATKKDIINTSKLLSIL